MYIMCVYVYCSVCTSVLVLEFTVLVLVLATQVLETYLTLRQRESHYYSFNSYY